MCLIGLLTATEKLRSAPYETDTVVLEEQLEGTRISRKACLVWQLMCLIGLLTATEKLRSAPYETDTVVLEEQLEGTRISRKGDRSTKVTPPSLKMVASGRKYTSRPTVTSPLVMFCNFLQMHQKKGEGVLT